MGEQPERRPAPSPVTASPVTAPPVVHTITGVPRPLSEEQDGRARRYVIAMAIRTVCVILTIVVPSPWRWFFAAGAVFLPYVAVVMANQRRRTPAGHAAAPTRPPLGAQRSEDG